MANMSYCRFENTYRDLMDCKNALDEKGGVNAVRNKSGQYEKPYVTALIELCKDIIDEYGDEEIVETEDIDNADEDEDDY